MRRQADRAHRAPREPRGGDVRRGQLADEERDRRDRGQALLAARRDRLAGHRARLRRERQGRPRDPGRVVARPAAREEPLHRAGPTRVARDRLQGQRGVARDAALRQVHPQADPDRVPQLGALRPERDRRGCGGALLLRHAPGQADPAPGGPARGAAPGAVELRRLLAEAPLARAHPRPHAPQPGARGDVRPALHQQRPLPGCGSRAAWHQTGLLRLLERRLRARGRAEPAGEAPAREGRDPHPRHGRRGGTRHPLDLRPAPPVRRPSCAAQCAAAAHRPDRHDRLDR